MTGLRVRQRDAAVPAGEGEEPRLRTVQPYAELRLKQSLFFTEQLLAHEAESEGDTVHGPMRVRPEVRAGVCYKVVDAGQWRERLVK